MSATLARSTAFLHHFPHQLPSAFPLQQHSNVHHRIRKVNDKDANCIPNTPQQTSLVSLHHRRGRPLPLPVPLSSARPVAPHQHCTEPQPLQISFECFTRLALRCLVILLPFRPRFAKLVSARQRHAASIPRSFPLLHTMSACILTFPLRRFRLMVASETELIRGCDTSDVDLSWQLRLRMMVSSGSSSSKETTDRRKL